MQFYFHSIFHSYASPFSSLLIFLFCLHFWSAFCTENMQNQSSKTEKILQDSPISYCYSSPPQKTATLPKTVIHRLWLIHFKIYFWYILLLAVKSRVLWSLGGIQRQETETSTYNWRTGCALEKERKETLLHCKVFLS